MLAVRGSIAKGIADNVLDTYIDPNIASQLAFMESELSQREWFTGDDITAADIMMSFPLEGAASRGGLDGKYPRLRAFLEKIHERPAYKRALEKGGPYNLI